MAIHEDSPIGDVSGGDTVEEVPKTACLCIFWDVAHPSTSSETMDTGYGNPLSRNGVQISTRLVKAIAECLYYRWPPMCTGWVTGTAGTALEDFLSFSIIWMEALAVLDDSGKSSVIGTRSRSSCEIRLGTPRVTVYRRNLQYPVKFDSQVRCLQHGIHQLQIAKLPS